MEWSIEKEDNIAQKREVGTKLFFLQSRGPRFTSVNGISLLKPKRCQKETFSENYSGWDFILTVVGICQGENDLKQALMEVMEM